MIFIDSHCHLPNIHHKNDLERILADARDCDVIKYINIGTTIKENVEVINVAETYAGVFAAIGIYPHEHRGENIAKLMEQLEEQAKSSKKVVAVGECGIDITDWKQQRPLEEQLQLFKAQIDLALKLNLPLIIHNRNADEMILQILADYGTNHPGLRGVVHCFDADWQVAQQFLDLGMHLSFSGKVTYPTQQALQEVARLIPQDKYLLETDSPFLLPEPAKSEARAQSVNQKNEPKYVRMVGQKVAELRQIYLAQAALQATDNTHRLFGLPT